MPKGIRSAFWNADENLKLFEKLCKKSEGAPIIKWKKFRRLDKDGKFEDFTIQQMASVWRKS